jgi:hypothetical protein
MRTILLVLCILSVTFSAKAQLFGGDWSEGSYYDLSGKKVSGLISWTPPQKSFLSNAGDYINYKANKEAKKIKVPSTQLQGFIIEQDSFVVSHYKDLTKAPFLEVLLNSPVKLYVSSISVSSAPVMMGGGAIGAMMAPGIRGGSKNYYYGTGTEDITKLDKKQFIEVMSKLMASKPEVVAKIQNKTFKYSKIADLVVYYKTGIIPVKEKGKDDDMY